MASIRFYIDPRGSRSSPARPLFAQITTERGRFKHYPQVEVHPDRWDTQKQRLILPRGGAEEAEQFNTQLEAYRARVMARWLNCGGDWERFKKEVRDGLDATSSQQQPVSMQEAIQLRLTDRRLTDSASTRAAYAFLVKRLNELHLGPLPLAQVTYSAYALLKDDLIERQNLLNSSANRFLGKFKTVLKHVATRHVEKVGEELAGKLLALLPRLDALPDDEPDIIAPYLDDVLTLAGLDIADKELALTRDRYVFACFTGPRHSDLNTLDREFNLAQEDGRYVLRYLPIKTKRRAPVEVPVNQYAYELLLRNLREGSPLLLQAVDNRRENERLHRILRDYGGQRFHNRVTQVAYQGGVRITQHLPRWQAMTFHTSRHFFAITLINNGVSLEHVRDLLGQRNLSSTLRYAKARSADVRRSAEGVLAGLMPSPLILPQ